MRTTSPLWVTATLLGIGCAGVPRHSGFDEVEETTKARTGHDLEWTREDESDDEARRVVAQRLKGELTLQDAVAIALLANPRLQALYEDLGISRARVVQASLPDNPVFAGDWRFFDAGWSFEGALAQNLMSVFTIPARRGMRQAELEATKAHVTAHAIGLIGDVKRAYYAYQANKQLVEMMQQVVLSTKSSYWTAAKLREAGNNRQLDVFRERALYEESKIQLNATYEMLARSREQLNALMGLWGHDTNWETPRRLADVPFEDLVEDLGLKDASALESSVQPSDVEAVPGRGQGTVHSAQDAASTLAGPPDARDVGEARDLLDATGEGGGLEHDAVAELDAGEDGSQRFAEVERAAVANSLQLARQRHLITAQAKRLNLETALAILPFFNAGVSAEKGKDSNEVGLGPMVGVPIPLWDGGYAAYPREYARLRQRLESYAAMAMELRASARALEARLQAARSRAIYYRDVIVPLRTAVVAEAQLQYNAMQISPFELLQAKRNQIAAGQAYVHALLDYWVARSEVEQLIDGFAPAGALAPGQIADGPGVLTAPGPALPN